MACKIYNVMSHDRNCIVLMKLPEASGSMDKSEKYLERGYHFYD